MLTRHLPAVHIYNLGAVFSTFLLLLFSFALF